MKRTLGLGVALVAALTVVVIAADRKWQKGIWAEVKVERPRFVLGVQPRPVGPGQAPAMTEIRTYVITTEDLRIELKEPSPPPRRSVDALAGQPVTFALEKNTVYVRADDGREHRLQVTKKLERRPEH